MRVSGFIPLLSRVLFPPLSQLTSLAVCLSHSCVRAEPQQAESGDWSPSLCCPRSQPLHHKMEILIPDVLATHKTGTRVNDSYIS